MSLLLRVIKRRTSWEKSAEEFYELELSNGAEADLNISVYEVRDDAQTVVRVISEHWASTKEPEPHSPCGAVDVSNTGNGTLEAVLGEGCFEFTRTTHRELRFMNESEVRGLARLLVSERESRTRTVEREKVRTYVAERVASQDAEWVHLAASKPKWREWAGKRRNTPSNTSSSLHAGNEVDAAARATGTTTGG